jgi:hypothetical protein
MVPKRTGGNMRAFFAALLAAALLGSSALPLGAETLDEIYAKAKGEGALSIYGGGPARLYEGWVKEYEARFPGVKVTVTGGYAGGLAPAIDKQIAEGNLAVDFVTFQAVQEFIRWKRGGVLLPFKMEGFEGARPPLPRCRRRLHAHQRVRYRAGLQYQAGGTRGCAEIGARLSQAHVPRQADHGLPERRRCDAVCFPYHRQEIRVALYG